MMERCSLIESACRLPGSIDSATKLWDLLVRKGSVQTPQVPRNRFNIDAHFHEDLERPTSPVVISWMGPRMILIQRSSILPLSKPCGWIRNNGECWKSATNVWNLAGCPWPMFRGPTQLFSLGLSPAITNRCLSGIPIFDITMRLLELTLESSAIELGTHLI